VAAIPFDLIRFHRAQAFHLLPGQRLNSRDDAVAFVNQRGFIYFWPITGITMPSLWAAVAGDRPVADEHDDPGHVTWGWKDAWGRAYYAMLRKSTMIAFDVPYFYVLTENYGSEDDYLTLYEQGRLTQEAKTVYEALLDEGPLDTIALRRAARMTSTTSDSRFNRALADLQADFKILPVGVTDSGAWHYAFAYDIVARHYPELPEQAQAISERLARQKLAELYFRSVGAARLGDLVKLFGWRLPAAEGTIRALVEAGLLRRGLDVEGQSGEWVALAELALASEAG
jgi:hypothetical protein